jgi:ribosomal protein uL22
MVKGYSCEFEKSTCASARLEGVDASYKDLAEVCGRIRRKTSKWAIEFLEKAAKGEIPVLYKRHNKKLGCRHELSGRKGRYPKKAAKIVLKVLRSAIANAHQQGLGEDLIIIHASANKKATYPRLSPKGRRIRSDYELSRIELVLKKAENKGA